MSSKRPVLTWKEQSKLREARKRKRISDDLERRDPKLLCSYEEYLELFPNEVILEIISYLDTRSHIAFAGVCKRWRYLALDTYTWRHVEIREKTCIAMHRIFKLALMGGHLRSLTLTGRPTVLRSQLYEVPLTAHALRSWFKEACKNLHSFRIERWKCTDGVLIVTELLVALPKSLKSLTINCSFGSQRQAIISTCQNAVSSFPNLTAFTLVMGASEMQLVSR